MNEREFIDIVWQKGHELYRDMPWRRDVRPYYVLVSELMLQQTQVDRVTPKFEAFIERFPDTASLAKASLADVLTLWSGLGYNRRAKFLHMAAQRITDELGGAFPTDYAGLLTLPGVGKNTAGAIMNYAFNVPTVFIETNVRTVYFYHFFAGNQQVSDVELLPLITATIDHEHPREFYWALMDYGSWLKRLGAGRISQSKHYKKQAPLKGSVREVRGQIIKALTASDATQPELEKLIGKDERFEPALNGLLKDELVSVTNERLHLMR